MSMLLEFICRNTRSPLRSAIVVSIGWGMILLSLLSMKFARESGESFWKMAGEHLGVALMVILAAHLISDALAAAFGG